LYQGNVYLLIEKQASFFRDHPATLSIVTFSLIILGIMTLGIMALSTMTLIIIILIIMTFSLTIDKTLHLA
jgi:hypothetical protein